MIAARPVSPDLDAELAAVGLGLTDADRARLLPVWAENLPRREALRREAFAAGEEPFEPWPSRPVRSTGPIDLAAVDAGHEAGDPCLMPLAAQARLLARGDLSSVELAGLYLDRIARHDGDLRAYMTVRAEEALAEARRADGARASGDARSPLHGLPVVVKDCIPIAGTRMTGGSRSLWNNVAPADAAAASALRAAGAVLLGTTRMHEFGAGPAAPDGPLATGRNPWDPSRIPGGSSSGSAVAVAAGLASAALGTDAAGSVRIPAAYSGIVGFKPTFGAVDRTGCRLLTWSLDTIGTMARSVTDAALLLEAIAPVRVGGDLEAGAAGLRLGVLRRFGLEAADVDDAVRRATEDALDILRREGATVETVDIQSVDRNDAVYTTLLAESYALHGPTLRDRPDDLTEWLKDQLRAAALVTADDYLRARRLRARIAAESLKALTDVDVLVLPAQAGPATPFGGSFIPALTQPRSRFTRPWNVTGLPAVALPHGLSADGLPLSLQVVGRPHDEATVVRVARAFERAAPWHRLRPDPAIWTRGRSGQGPAPPPI